MAFEGVLLLLVLVLPFADAQSSNGCIASFDPSINYFSTAFANQPFALPIQVGTTITSAYNFTVQYKNYYKVVTDTHAGTTYYLYLCGAPQPTANGPATGMIQIPLTSYGMISTVPGNFLQLLGQLGGLKKVEDAQVVDPCLQKVVGGLSPPSPFLGPMVDGNPGPYNSSLLSFSASQDPGILSRAEWIKYLALFFNQEDRAQVVFESIRSQYACLNGSAPAAETKPTAAWLSFYAGGWTLSDSKYKRQLVEDAGGVNPAFGQLYFNMSIPTDVSAFHAFLQSVDVVLDETFLPAGPSGYSIDNFTANAQLSGADASRLMHNIWSIYGQYATYPDGSATTAWFEAAISQPQVVVRDVLAILHPSKFGTSFTPTFFYNLHMGNATLLTAESCTSDAFAAVEPTSVAPVCSPVSGNAAARLVFPALTTLALLLPTLALALI